MFSEVKLFQVKPEKIDEFERLVRTIRPEQRARTGCLDIHYTKRLFVLEDLRPRPLTKIVKCVKCHSYWTFDCQENYASAIQWFFEAHARSIQRLLIVPFDIYCGEEIE